MERHSKSSRRYVCLLFVSVLCGCGKEIPPPDVPPGKAEEWKESLGVRLDSEAFYQENLHEFDYDREQPLELAEVASWQEDGLTFTDITYASPKGGKVPATIIAPSGKGPFAGVIVQHGMPSRRENEYMTGKVHASMGAVVILIDAPFARPENKGRRPVQFTEQDRRQLIQLIVDLRRAADVLIAREDVDPNRLAYVGASYGGAIGGLFAGVEDRLQAYVLVVGDAGLVTHLMFDRKSGKIRAQAAQARRQWIEAMWPLESIHYVGHAAPAALLFQNGTRDASVSPYMALWYQRAGSDPKTVKWYDSGHRLPTEHLMDQLEWLSRYIGIPNVRDLPRVNLIAMDAAESSVVLYPQTRKSAIVVDRLMVLWFVLVAASFLYMIRDLLGETRSSPGVLLGWLLTALLFGPLGLLAYLLSYRKGAVPEPGPPPIWVRAFGSTVWSVAGYLVGLIAAIAFLDRHTELYDSPLLVLLLVVGSPVLTRWVLNLLSRLGRRQGLRRRVASRRSFLSELISVSVAVAVALPLFAVFRREWFDLWYRSPGWYVSSPPFWAVASIVACASAVIVYPAHLWLLRDGMLEWTVASRIEEPRKLKQSSPEALIVAFLSSVALLFCFHLTFGVIL